MKSLVGTRRAGDECFPAFLPQLPETRPSLFDPLLHFDLWFERCPGSDLLALFQHNRPVALLSASPFDHFSLNQQLMQLRQRGGRGEWVRWLEHESWTVRAHTAMAT